jgi:hypothetical protein
MLIVGIQDSVLAGLGIYSESLCRHAKTGWAAADLAVKESQSYVGALTAGWVGKVMRHALSEISWG